MRAQPGNCQIKIRRNHIFEDSYAEIMRQTPNDLKKRLMIKFDGEDGLDYGGLSRCDLLLISLLSSLIAHYLFVAQRVLLLAFSRNVQSLLLSFRVLGAR